MWSEPFYRRCLPYKNDGYKFIHNQEGKQARRVTQLYTNLEWDLKATGSYWHRGRKEALTAHVKFCVCIICGSGGWDEPWRLFLSCNNTTESSILSSWAPIESCSSHWGPLPPSKPQPLQWGCQLFADRQETGAAPFRASEPDMCSGCGGKGDHQSHPLPGLLLPSPCPFHPLPTSSHH